MFRLKLIIGALLGAFTASQALASKPSRGTQIVRVIQNLNRDWPLRVTEIDTEHRTEVRLDGLQIGKLDHMKATVSRARFTLGPGPSNCIPTGDDVAMVGRSGKRKWPASYAVFVPFAEADER